MNYKPTWYKQDFIDIPSFQELNDVTGQVFDSFGNYVGTKEPRDMQLVIDTDSNRQYFAPKDYDIDNIKYAQAQFDKAFDPEKWYGMMYDPQLNIWENIASAAVEGTKAGLKQILTTPHKLVSAGIGIANSLTGNKGPLLKEWDTISRAAAQNWEQTLNAFGFEKEVNTDLVNIAALAGDTGASLLIAAAVSSMGGLPAVAATFGGTQYHDIREEYLEKGFSFEEAHKYATAAALSEGLIEMVGFKYWKRAATMNKSFKNYVLAALPEAMQEGAQTSMEAYITNMTGLREQEFVEIAAEIFISALVGGVVGAGGALVTGQAEQRVDAMENALDDYKAKDIQNKAALAKQAQQGGDTSAKPIKQLDWKQEYELAKANGNNALYNIVKTIADEHKVTDDKALFSFFKVGKQGVEDGVPTNQLLNILGNQIVAFSNDNDKGRIKQNKAMQESAEYIRTVKDENMQKYRETTANALDEIMTEGTSLTKEHKKAYLENTENIIKNLSNTLGKDILAENKLNISFRPYEAEYNMFAERKGIYTHLPNPQATQNTQENIVDDEVPFQKENQSRKRKGKKYKKAVDRLKVVDAMLAYRNYLQKIIDASEKRIKGNLLTILRAKGADYANAAQTSMEAYKNAGIPNKKDGIGDKPALWLRENGFIANNDEQAFALIQAALDGQEVLSLEGLNEVAQRADREAAREKAEKELAAVERDLTRGQINGIRTSINNIALGNNADFTTLQHEFIHWIDGIIERYAKEGNEAAKALWAERNRIVEKHWDEGNIDLNDRQRAAEIIAEAYEVWLYNGAKSDNKETQKLFNLIRQFFRDVYSNIKAISGVTLDEDIDRYFRILSGEEDIESIMPGEMAEDGSSTDSAPRYQNLPKEAYDKDGKADINSSAFKKWFGNSKAVDEQGRPLVVYHGTDASFTAFDMSKGRANMDIRGAFFSPWEEDAKGYGSRVGSYYLSIQNPADESAGYAALRRFQGQNEAGKKAKAYLQSLGYDSVINNNEEYIAFEPNQIKSVYNRGTFDANDDNIYYQPLYKGLDSNKEVGVVDLSNTPVKDKKDLKKFINTLIGTKETTADGAILTFVKKVKRTGQKAQKIDKHIVYSSFGGKKDLHDKAVNSILDLIKKSVLVEEGPQKKNKPDYDKVYRFYVPVQTQSGIYPVRLVALHNKNNKEVEITGDIYDLVIEKGPITNPQLNASKGDRPTISIAEMLANVNDMDDKPYFQRAYHGTPHRFDKFSSEAIGTGEGAQAHGWGLYFAKNKGTTIKYRTLKSDNIYYKGEPIEQLRQELEKNKEYDRAALIEDFMLKMDAEALDREYFSQEDLSWFKNEIEPHIKQDGQLFEVEIPDNDVLLDEQKRFTEQPLKVKKALRKLFKDNGKDLNEVMKTGYVKGNPVGGQLYNEVMSILADGSDKKASLLLNEYGIKGITYEGGLDGRSFVVFDDKAIEVIETYYQKKRADREQKFRDFQAKLEGERASDKRPSEEKIDKDLAILERQGKEEDRWESAKEVAEQAADLAGDLIITIRQRAGSVDKRLKYALDKLDFNERNLEQNLGNRVKPFIKEYQKLSRGDRNKLNYLLKHGLSDRLEKEFGNNEALMKAYKETRQVLNAIYAAANQAGINMHFLEEYFPTSVKDHGKFIDYLKKTGKWTYIERALHKLDPNGVMGEAERADAINKILSSGRDLGLGRKPKNANKRSVLYADPNLLQFYEDADVALMKYITSMSQVLATKKAFGLSPAFNTDETIGAIVEELISTNMITRKEEKLIRKLLKARLSYAATPKIISWLKNIGYLTTMNNITSAATQIGDLYASFYKYGTATALEAIFGKKELTAEDLALDRVWEEFEDGKNGAIYVNKLFKVVGLNKMDAFGKAANINAALIDLRKKAKADDIRLYEKAAFAFGKDGVKVVEDIKAGKVTPDIKLLLWTELADTQPIGKSGLPVGYLTTPYGRLFYQLKTYTINQMSLFYADGLLKIQKGIATKDKKMIIEGTRNISKLALLLILSNAGADVVKNIIMGRQIDLSDTVVSNILWLAGVSKYTFYKGKREGYARAIFSSYIMPPQLSSFDDIVLDTKKIAQGKRELKDTTSISYIPYGRTIYWWFGGGRTKEIEKGNKTFVNISL